MTTAPPQSASLVTARIIAAAMMLGVVALWVIAWVISKGGTAPMNAEIDIASSTVMMLWAVLAASGFAAALFLQRTAANLADDARLTGRPQQQANVKAQSRLVIAWALLEAPALLAGVALILIGARTVMLVAIPVFLVGMAVTFPRAEWFATDQEL